MGDRPDSMRCIKGWELDAKVRELQWERKELETRLHYRMKDIEEKQVRSDTRFAVMTGVAAGMFLSTVLHRCTSSRQSGSSSPDSPAKPSHDRGSSNPFSAE